MAEKELLAGILDDPDDDAVRLVYADWLEEHGGENERARAEFIRLQLRRARLQAGSTEAEAIERREKELLRRHGHGWDLELRSLVPDCEYRRGFIEEINPYSSFEEVAPALRDFPALAPRLWELAPVRKLVLWETEEELRRALSCDRLATLAELRVEADLEGADEVRALASPHLRGLTHLSFGVTKDEADEAIPALFETPWPRLRKLDFSCLDVARAARALARSPVACQLTALGLAGDGGGEEAGQVLAGCAALGGLTELTSSIGDRGAAALVRSTHLRSLRALCLSHSHLSARTAAALAEARWLDSLVTLDLYYNRLGAEGCRALAGARAANLTTLNLGSNDLDAEALEALAAGVCWPKLSDLTLTHNGLTGEAIVALAGSPLLASVARLELHSNRIDLAGARALARSPHLSELRSLGLGSNLIGTEGVEALARSASMPRLVELEVGYNGIDAEGVRLLASSPLLGRLRGLRLAGNQFGAAALRLLLEALAVTGLDWLDLQGCHIGDEGAEVVADSPQLASLYFLDLGYNDVTDEGARRLLGCAWLAGVPHVKWGGNKIQDEAVAARMHEQFPEHPGRPTTKAD
jgi:uncharacterized protein (TIGR02996 family)